MCWEGWDAVVWGGASVGELQGDVGGMFGGDCYRGERSHSRASVGGDGLRYQMRNG